MIPVILMHFSMPADHQPVGDKKKIIEFGRKHDNSDPLLLALHEKSQDMIP